MNGADANPAEPPFPDQPELVPVELPTRLNRHARRAKAARAKREFKVGSRTVVRDRTKPQLYRYVNGGEGGYEVCHPTKGWRTFNPRRLARIAVTNKLKGRYLA